MSGALAGAVGGDHEELAWPPSPRPSRVNAIRVPSGDHDGSVSSPGVDGDRDGFPPSSAMRMMSRPSPAAATV